MSNIAHYPGKVDLDPDSTFGPDRYGARYKMVSVDYDPVEDRSTVSFKPYMGEQ